LTRFFGSSNSLANKQCDQIGRNFAIGYFLLEHFYRNKQLKHGL